MLDFSHALAGPLCTFHLGLLGADVIKVERPGVGDDLRGYTGHGGSATMSAPFVAANAGKRSIEVDLKSEHGQEVVRRLVATADVVVENFRPGVPEKLHIDHRSLARINPRIVYCSITGFGGRGALKDWVAYDHIVQAMSGVMWLNGEPGQGPLKVGIPFADTFSGYVAAFSIMTALFQRERTGQGQFIDIGMLDATLVLLSQGVATYRMSGQVPRRTGNRGYRLVATADTYDCLDGHVSIGANHPHQYDAMCRALGWEDLARDGRFADPGARERHNDVLRETLAARFATLRADDVERLLAAASVPVARVRSIPEIVDHAHVLERDPFVAVRVPDATDAWPLMSSGFRLDEDLPVRTAAVPSVGQHTAEIEAELGLLPEPSARG